MLGRVAMAVVAAELLVGGSIWAALAVMKNAAGPRL